ncbi:MAG: ribosome biogenesis GTP-binding protein YihA/YsxC [Rhodospirillales bacterium]
MGDHAPRGGDDLSAAEEADAAAEAAALERGRVLFAGHCEFVTAAARIEQLPEATLPEVAFAGRSNVGKSSLINALTGRRTLAKTSNTPGRTQQVNFFSLAGQLTLVDLPGYGYASAPKAKVTAWTRLVELYLAGRPPLRRTLLMIDARHGIKDVDRQIMAILDRAAVSYQVVLTKADKITSAELADRTAAVEAEVRGHPAAHPEVIATSARAQAGIERLRAGLAALSDWAAETSA